jgi:hypothetical protein
VERWQNESVGCSIGPRDALWQALAGKSDAMAQTGGSDPTADGPRRSRIALERSNAAKAPIKIANSRQRLNEKLMAFTRDEIRYAEQCSHRGTLRPRGTARPSRAGRDDCDPLARDAVALDRGGGRVARTEDAADPGKQSRLTGGGVLRRGRQKTGLKSQRTMDEGDEPQAACFRHKRFVKIGESQAIDNRPGPLGKAGEHGAIRMRVSIH